MRFDQSTKHTRKLPCAPSAFNAGTHPRSLRCFLTCASGAITGGADRSAARGLGVRLQPGGATTHASQNAAFQAFGVAPSSTHPHCRLPLSKRHPGRFGLVSRPLDLCFCFLSRPTLCSDHLARSMAWQRHTLDEMLMVLMGPRRGNWETDASVLHPLLLE